MFKNPAVGVQGYEVTLSHPVRSPASYGSMRVCFAVPSLLSSLSLAFLLLPPAESLIVNQQQQSPSPPATVTSSSHHDLYSAFSSLQLSPLAAASDFSLSHRPGCDLQLVTRVFRKNRAMLGSGVTEEELMLSREQ